MDIGLYRRYGRKTKCRLWYGRNSSSLNRSGVAKCSRRVAPFDASCLSLEIWGWMLHPRTVFSRRRLVKWTSFSAASDLYLQLLQLYHSPPMWQSEGDTEGSWSHILTTLIYFPFIAIGLNKSAIDNVSTLAFVGPLASFEFGYDLHSLQIKTNPRSITISRKN